jgi:flagellar motor switch protein FliN/FliY
VAEAANQMMAAASSAIGTVLGHEIEISPPDTRVLEDPARAQDLYGTAPHATSTTFVIAGESCRLIQLVPRAFVVRLVRAIDDQAAAGAATAGSRGARADAPMGLQAVLGETRLRVWAELGRTRMALGRALTLPLGAVVDLDQPADAPVQLFVNGVAFAQGHLIVRDGDWAVCIDRLLGAQASPAPSESIDPNQLEGAVS